MASPVSDAIREPVNLVTTSPLKGWYPSNMVLITPVKNVQIIIVNYVKKKIIEFIVIHVKKIIYFWKIILVQ